MINLKNINGYLVSSLNLKEAIEKEQQKIIATGLLCPKNKISRNSVMYDWDSIKNTYNQIKGLKLLYNHETEGLNAIPIGHATNAWLKEEDDDDGIAGLYYEADLDPEHPQTRKILRGDLDNVSLQINAAEVIPKYDEKFGEYQLAKISDWIEFSVVPTPGMKDATIEARIAEAYKKEKRLKEDHVEKGIFPIDEFQMGIDVEKSEHSQLNILEIGQLVLDHLKENEYYYSSKNSDEETKTEEINTSTASGAMAPAVMKDDEEDDTMSKENIKKEEAPIMNPEDYEKTKTEQVDEDEVKEDEVKYESIKKEEYEDDMTSMTDILEQMNGKINSLTEELANLKGQLPQTESAVEDTEADEVKEEQADDTQVVSDDKTKIDTEVIEESDDETSDEEDKIDEPIPPITEKKKEKSELKDSIKKETVKKTEMTFEEAIRGFTKERLGL